MAIGNFKVESIRQYLQGNNIATQIDLVADPVDGQPGVRISIMNGSASLATQFEVGKYYTIDSTVVTTTSV